MSIALPIIEEDRDASPIVSYAYSYPHKSSYQRLDPVLTVAQAWQNEYQDGLALYIHIPFCEMRCGFCNLFTESQPEAQRIRRYLQTLARQMSIVRSAVPNAQISTFAIGGGTPTYLSADDLQWLLGTTEASFDFLIRDVPTSVETSPATATIDRLKILANFGVQRISLGVQSFLETETQKFGRPQRTKQVQSALDAIRSLNFPVLNVDLIYGSPIQTISSWEQSLSEALQFAPEEFYLYPLYVRPETGLARTGHQATRHRADLYRSGRDFLLRNQYIQVSLRCFRHHRHMIHSDDYSCQRDGMIGVGCGARSYTNRLHYSTPFAVSQTGIQSILNTWICQSDDDLGRITQGVWLNDDEQRRRFAILSLLQSTGLSVTEYQHRFGSSPVTDLPVLIDLRHRGWLCEKSDRISLTQIGMENSDVIGPILFSDAVRSRLQEFVEL